MNAPTIAPPQPIPYPHNPLIKKLYRTPILLYRLGLGSLIGNVILILSTFGRKTGQVHRTPVEYFQYQGQLYVMSGFAGRPDWYKNLQADPHASLSIKGQRICAKARPPRSEAEWEGVIAFLQSSPVAQFSEPELKQHLEQPDFRAAIKTWPVLTFDATDEPCPPALDADLTWAWPLILLSTAGLLLIKWLHLRKQ